VPAPLEKSQGTPTHRRPLTNSTRPPQNPQSESMLAPPLAAASDELNEHQGSDLMPDGSTRLIVTSARRTCRPPRRTPTVCWLWEASRDRTGLWIFHRARFTIAAGVVDSVCAQDQPCVPVRSRSEPARHLLRFTKWQTCVPRAWTGDLASLWCQASTLLPSRLATHRGTQNNIAILRDIGQARNIQNCVLA
jgi:hypothetical protein